MKVSDLSALLKKVAPALSKKDFVPVFSCFCFDGETVTAFDDVVAMQIPCEFEIKGGAKGATLQSWLSACSGNAELNVEQIEGGVKLKAGRSRIELAMIDEEQFLHEFPEEDAEDIEFTDELVSAMLRCTTTMGNDPTVPALMGITLSASGKKLSLYSTDNYSATFEQLRIKDKNKWVAVLSPRFCELFAAIAPNDKPQEFYLDVSWAEVVFESGLRLYSKNISEHDVDRYDSLFSSIGEDVLEEAVAMPKGIESALDRALVVLNDEHNTATLKFSDGRLKLTASTPLGSVVDQLKVKGHPDAECDIVPKVFKRCLEDAGSFIVREDFIVFAGETHLRLMAPVRDGGEDEE